MKDRVGVNNSVYGSRLSEYEIDEDDEFFDDKEE